MKKSLLLTIGLLLSAITPGIAAEPVTATFSLFQYENESFTHLGDYEGTIEYNETTNTYSMPNFLGYGVDYNFKLGALNETYGAYDIEVLNAVNSFPEYSSYTLVGAADKSGKFVAADGTSKAYQLDLLELYESPYSSVFPPELPDYPNYSLQLVCYTTIIEVAEDGSTTTGTTDDFYLTVDLPEPTAGIGNVAIDNVDANAAVRYYNLQGMEIVNPEAGNVYIRRQGSQVRKIVF